MEALQHPFGFQSSSSSLPLHPNHSSSRPSFTALFCTPSSSHNPSKRPLRSIYRGSNEVSLKVLTIAHGRTRSRSGGQRTLIVMRSNAAVGYAAALAEIGRSHKILEAINADVEKLGRFLQDKQFHDFLTNPTIKESDKKSILKSLADEAGFVPYTLNLLNLIVDRKRTTILKDIVKEFEELYNEITDTEVAIVTSAVKINTAQLAQIAKKIQSMSGAKNVRLKNVVDASLVAGFIVRYGKDGSRLIDMSVKGQLDRIAQQINFVEQVGIVGV